jgi:hypothetical protein
MELKLTLNDLKEIRKIVRTHATETAHRQRDFKKHDPEAVGMRGYFAQKAEEAKALLALLDHAVRAEEKRRKDRNWPTLNDHLIQEAKEAFNREVGFVDPLAQTEFHE